ncbi:FAD-dependent oxidoreductase [Robbsia andropogonis]|uniref:FAD-dependent oxidoreductase n=1 Tax=Robbsia andropogonis TaxID=28092 RepID=UPI0020A1B2B7|nr:NAD(P)/FAD-dependent oxidoreductase [Robbsia andropogonis]MCP1127282.1 NAD(P)/FAD-dependent oxidoreductase [Robbsia andropogonis]
MASDLDVRKSYAVVVVGGGAGGIGAAARLKKMEPSLDIVIIDPAEYHYYQPAWTLVGGGQFAINDTRRRMRDCVPTGIDLIASEVTGFEPERNAVVLDGGARVNYKYLVVAAGIQLDWDAIEGLTETLGQNDVTSNYRFDLAPYTWECVRRFKGGTAIFTQPPMPIKCAGAPQKILYLAADYFRKHRVTADIQFCTPGPSMFGVLFFSKALDQVMADYGAKPCFGQKLVKVDGPNKTAYFEITKEGEKSVVSTRFDMLHVVPPQSAPKFIKESPLADAAGWVEVDKSTLRHVRFANIYGIGDCTCTPNSKTAAAVKNQIPVVATNLMTALRGRGTSMTYDGYASCPLTTSAGRVMLAEFCYDGVVTPTFPVDPRSPRRFFWWLKRRFLPWLYWNIVLKGKRWPLTHKRRQLTDALPHIAP